MSVVIRRNPMRELSAMQSAMDRFFEDTWRGYDRENENILAVDIHETDAAYLLMSNVPGVNPDDIEITLHDNVLTINAELPKPVADDGVRFHVQERPYGHYTRTVRLPKSVDNEGVDAAYENGVLMLTVPKAADAQPRQIRIKTSGALDSNNS